MACVRGFIGWVKFDNTRSLYKDQSIPPAVHDVFMQGIAVNSTAEVGFARM